MSMCCGQPPAICPLAVHFPVYAHCLGACGEAAAAARLFRSEALEDGERFRLSAARRLGPAKWYSHFPQQGFACS